MIDGLLLLAGVGEQALSETACTGPGCLLQVVSARAEGREHPAQGSPGLETGR